MAEAAAMDIVEPRREHQLPEAVALEIVDEGNETKPWHRDAWDKGPGPTHAPVLGQPPGNVLPKGPLTTLTELAELVRDGLAELDGAGPRPAGVPEPAGVPVEVLGRRHVHMRGL